MANWTLPHAFNVASSSPSSPCEERVGRGPRRGEANKNPPALPSPLLHPMEEREKSRSLMQPWLMAIYDPFHLTSSRDLPIFADAKKAESHQLPIATLLTSN